MFRRRLTVLVAAFAALIALSYVAQSFSSQGAAAAVSADAPTVDRAELDRLIGLFRTRSADRAESLEFRTLGSLLLQRADLNADVTDYRDAADAYAASLQISPDHRDALLGSALASLGVHDFATAGQDAATLLRLDPADLDALALAGDVAFAVGSYEEAADAFDPLLAQLPDDPAVLVRLSQLERLRSGSEVARQLAEEALGAAGRRGLAPAQLAFYEAFAGNLAYESGAYEAAASLLERAVAHAPTDHGALGELARVRAATGDLEGAVELLERANTLIPEPDHLFLQGDLKALIGDAAGAAADHAAGVALATRDSDHERAWARALATYWLDHDGDIVEAQRIASAELAARQDVGAWDLAAWAAYRAGDLDAARRAIDTALSYGVADATLWYHAGAISAASGDAEQAVARVTAALAVNPGFDPRLSIDARVLLESLTAALP